MNKTQMFPKDMKTLFWIPLLIVVSILALVSTCILAGFIKVSKVEYKDTVMEKVYKPRSSSGAVYGMRYDGRPGLTVLGSDEQPERYILIVKRHDTSKIASIKVTAEQWDAAKENEVVVLTEREWSMLP